ncbi:MAG: hypothetical protein JXP34_24225 [Planctomycetes bacterium]|nr:hypothetical protein [Planctomycetota bacterium]
MPEEPIRKPDAKDPGASGEEIAAFEILGAFLAVFGAALLVAVFFTGGTRIALSLGSLKITTAQVTNLVCGLLILGIGAGMFLRGRARRRKRN